MIMNDELARMEVVAAYFKALSFHRIANFKVKSKLRAPKFEV
jgi:hypothetical protein